MKNGDFFNKIANQNFGKSTLKQLEREQFEMHLKLIEHIVRGLKSILDEYELQLKTLGYAVHRFANEHYFRFTVRDKNSNTLEIGLGHYYDIQKWSIGAKINDTLLYCTSPKINEAWSNADFENWMQLQIIEFINL